MKNYTKICIKIKFLEQGNRADQAIDGSMLLRFSLKKLKATLVKAKEQQSMCMIMERVIQEKPIMQYLFMTKPWKKQLKYQTKTITSSLLLSFWMQMAQVLFSMLIIDRISDTDLFIATTELFLSTQPFKKDKSLRYRGLKLILELICFHQFLDAEII